MTCSTQSSEINFWRQTKFTVYLRLINFASRRVVIIMKRVRETLGSNSKLPRQHPSIAVLEGKGPKCQNSERSDRGSHSGPGCPCVVSQISKSSPSATSASQTNVCSLSTVDQIANLLPNVQSRAMLCLA